MKNKKPKRTPQGQFNTTEQLLIQINKNNVKHQAYINEKRQAYKQLGMKYDE
jgi:5,10-methylene-tetrahydrofolate dehydrogenase/methenyl tetrahydrofolate cyclohydrolase